MYRSGLWSKPDCSPRPYVMGLLLSALLLSACSSNEQGQMCVGKVETLSGQSLGTLQGRIIDRFSSFSVNLPSLKLDSGPLHSNDRQLYIPMAVTEDGWLTQRISDHRFALINAPKDQAITLTCP
ncbi:hypothetical protein [Erwinia amylovora]|uniref:Lipoprotein n=3 Tax=Erwinia amylovora TaxID=552 RepID=A0A830ZRH1_ERWAM|nr:hypothetical protein [Erwinia amylovora]CDK14631.1 hypothetical protein LA635_1007 [Erwinia amylovora LA635]CDK17999.1 hypothetical protein LA636_1007 [Erwinia amylovora LA636]CDK21368.1 hypothetical protein LA637_1008 [Erwinia amylovora LA637]ATZ10964.1 hypothetical protein AD997_05555 [Erwinia amylovora]EKV53787.1 hypothetical protein EaACW_1087 [Erwinia amylovora ACW56400]